MRFPWVLWNLMWLAALGFVVTGLLWPRPRPRPRYKTGGQMWRAPTFYPGPRTDVFIRWAHAAADQEADRMQQAGEPGYLESRIAEGLERLARAGRL